MLKLILNWWRDKSFLIALSVTILIIITSLISSKSINLVSFHVSDKILHTLSYVILMNAWLMVLIRLKRIDRKWMLFIILTLFGIIIEVMQGAFTDTRTPDVKDVLANTLGLLIGLMIFKTFIYKGIE